MILALFRILLDVLDDLRLHFFFFFFQAEDGIRDLTVTGVQTCALPISRTSHSCCGSIEGMREPARTAGFLCWRWVDMTRPSPTSRAAWRSSLPRLCTKIGRASCRERV